MNSQAPTRSTVAPSAFLLLSLFWHAPEPAAKAVRFGTAGALRQGLPCFPAASPRPRMNERCGKNKRRFFGESR
jgi:hypothetical protein